jgi:tRNA(Arg) A34 adenosine deaminase TadA
MESRRGFLQAVAATAAVGVATDGIAAAQAGASGSQTVHPPAPQQGRLKHFWEGTVKDLVSLPAPKLTAAETERHRIYCGLLSALMVHYWNGNKKGKDGKYPWREKQFQNGQYLGGDYLGHNIACIAVDAQGEVIDFDFNHNDIFSSSVEHAESRLVRRIFSLAQLNNGWATKGFMAPVAPTPYSNILSDVTVYTSLESCSQCSGIMALGAVKEVVFLQRDPGQSSIGNILRQLSPEKSGFKAPLPIPGDTIAYPRVAASRARGVGSSRQRLCRHG